MAIFLKRKITKELKNTEINFITKINDNLPHIKIAILNLMPTLEDTEKHFLKVLDIPFLQVEVDFIYLETKIIKEEKRKYYQNNYKSFKEIKNIFYDGIIITGAPLEHLQDEEITFLKEMQEFLDYTTTNSKSTLFLCWATKYSLKYFYGIDSFFLPSKLSGVYKHIIINKTNITKDFDDTFFIPHSRYCTLDKKMILANSNLIIFSESIDAGVFGVQSIDGKQIFLTGHAEYDRWTLDKEYQRDLQKSLDILPPFNYYNNQDLLKPKYIWQAHARLLYQNWLIYYVYQNS